MRGAKNFSINKKSKNWLKLLIGALALLFLLVVINIFVSQIKNSFYILSSPLQKTFWAAGESSSGFLGSIFKVGSLAKENENLNQQNQKLLSQIASLQSIQEGNKAQSDVSVACQNTGFKLLMVGIVGSDGQDNLSVNKGSADGILEGMPVINQQNVLFGKISKVYKNFSTVMLVSNTFSVVNVKVQQADPTAPEIDGVVRGSGGLTAYLDLIPIASNINPQDVLVTSAIDKSFPKDLLVARIDQKQKNDQKPFQGASVDLFFDVKAVDNLFVITNYKQATN